ncbi:MAG: flagellar hook-basal body complex protein, partial [Desulfovibrionaceae bacterium]|nr:flagellar hook-basal body complex protein [Desulfovibrionaceae bacterium]
MNSALYIGATGMKGLSQGMQVTSNNIANVSTIGFKQQNILFADLLYTAQGNLGSGWESQEDSKVALGQTGKGLQVEAIRTIFNQGNFESTNNATDLAINGKGFFQVSDDVSGATYYTRAGDFTQDIHGVLRMPSCLALNGYRIDANGRCSDTLSNVTIDSFSTMPARASSAVELSLNLIPDQDKSINAANPYFSLLNAYDASSGSPLSTNAYSSSQTMTLYDSAGQAHTVTAYFDGAPAPSGSTMMEFIIAGEGSARYDANGNPVDVAPGDGLLMSGVLHFDSSGRLTDISAFTPGSAGSKDLADWQAAPLTDDGLPQMSLKGNAVSLDFGISSNGGWQNMPGSAAAVGTDANSLGGLGGEISRSAGATVANGGSTLGQYSQNGYAEGILSTFYINRDGTVEGYFSNGQSQDLWQIPVCRFVSEDGLRREGSNLFSATAEAGQMEIGIPGTENYGSVNSYNIESSNVDLSMEMVNMIVTQRGFQSNS